MSNSPAPGMIHTVYFWLTPGLSDADFMSFVDGCKSLSTVPVVQRYYGGTGAGTPARDGVTQKDYDYSIHLFFASVEDHNTYQDHPVHLAFVDQHAGKFATVRVYDNVID